MGLKKEELRKDALNLIRNAAGQNAVGASQDRFGPQASPVDEYEFSITKIMHWSGITVNDARQALDGFEAPYMRDVLAALTRIETKQKKKP